MLSELLQQYGYIVVFAAGLFEGETILMIGAFAVHQGYLSLGPLIACGAAAAFLTDQFYFHLGRRKGAGCWRAGPSCGTMSNGSTASSTAIRWRPSS